MKRKLKGLMGFLLSLALVMGLMPVQARAAEGYGGSRTLYVESNYSGGSGNSYPVRNCA